jgi:hypothetical protein
MKSILLGLLFEPNNTKLAILSPRLQKMFRFVIGPSYKDWNLFFFCDAGNRLACPAVTDVPTFSLLSRSIHLHVQVGRDADPLRFGQLLRNSGADLAAIGRRPTPSRSLAAGPADSLLFVESPPLRRGGRQRPSF